ncbi:zinc-binding dehydrogenase (plasmid) [Ensifer sp. PDNC004]|nr:zinc-binding dehydrogenase [Ensifer sp. PDNC004]
MAPKRCERAHRSHRPKAPCNPPPAHRRPCCRQRASRRNSQEKGAVDAAAAPRPSVNGYLSSIVGGAGGVGTVLTQLACRLTGLTVIATASREKSRDWCLQMGAHHVLDHRRPLPQQVEALEAPPVRYVASLTHTAQHLAELIEIIEPHGKIGVIDDHDSLDAAPLKAKSLSLHWEMVFTRPLYGTADLIGQHRILKEVASLTDAGVLRSTMTKCLSPFSAENLEEGHRLVEGGAMVGKVVMSRGPSDVPQADQASVAP